MDFGRAALVVQPENEAETRGALPEKVFDSQNGDVGAGEKFSASGVCTMAIPQEGGLVVLCGRVRQVADSISEPRAATRHRANRS